MKKIFSAQNIWLDATIITIEVDTNNSLPWIEIIWLPDNSIKESRERIKIACKNSNITFTPKKYVVNLAPSNVKKFGSRFDLAIATWLVLMMSKNCKNQEIFLSNCLIFWELWLDWTIKYIQWLLPTILSSKKQWWKNFIIPYEAIDEVSFVQWVSFYALQSFDEIISFIKSNNGFKKIWWWWVQQKFNNYKHNYLIKHSIYWHILAKKVMKIAVLWKHNVLLIWSPWTWKTLLAHYLWLLLPPLDYKESLEVTAIHSAWWKLPPSKMISKRPFIKAHSSISYGWMFGWWTYLHPWLVSLAHRWVLFLDEMWEFKRDILEWLRQPMQDKKIMISRIHWSAVYPADCMVVATMNPCRCWYYWDTQKQCICSSNEIKRYQAKISWPLLDRFDIILDVTRQPLSDELWQQEFVEDISQLYKWYAFINKHRQKMTVSKSCKDTVKLLSKKFTLSWRVVSNLLNLSSSIAWYNQIWSVKKEHILEAYQYRSMRMVIDL